MSSGMQDVWCWDTLAKTMKPIIHFCMKVIQVRWKNNWSSLRTEVDLGNPWAGCFVASAMEVSLERLSVWDRRWRDARDVKLREREDLLAQGLGLRRRVCCCEICIGENRSLMLRSSADRHLKLYGRHPLLRGSTLVRFPCLHVFCFRDWNFLLLKLSKSVILVLATYIIVLVSGFGNPAFPEAIF